MMNARTLRRAAERKARKLTRRTDEGRANDATVKLVHREDVSAGDGPGSAKNTGPAGELPESVAACNSSAPSSQARLAANRHNAQASTGPKTNEGKGRSSLNALKTALTGRTVLLPTDDVERYRDHVNAWAVEYKPVGPRECLLVQAIADSYWRSERIVRLEFALFAQGHADLEREATNDDPNALLDPNHNSTIELQTLLRFEKQLRNLHIQEARLNRQREKDKKELALIQSERGEREAAAEQLPTPADSHEGLTERADSGTSTSQTPAASLGFVFSTAESSPTLSSSSHSKRSHNDAEQMLRPATAA